jgi:hypothetical protein
MCASFLLPKPHFNNHYANLLLSYKNVTFCACCATCGDDRSFKVWNLKDNTLLYAHAINFTTTANHP